VVVERPRRPPPPPEPEPDVAADVDVEPVPVEKPTAPPRPRAPRAAGDMVRVIGPSERPEKANGDGPATAPRRRPARPAPEPESAGESPERKLARRLASTSSGGRTRPASAGSEAPVASAAPADEAMWHGPGSGEPAPTVRIRADLAAGTRRPESGEAPSPPATTTRTRRRERPLRAR